MSKFYDVAYAIRDAYENQCLISVDALLKLINNCDEIEYKSKYKIEYYKYYSSYPVYIMKLDQSKRGERHRYKLWLYFYDENNVLIAEFYGLDTEKYDVNFDNHDNMMPDFIPIIVDRHFL